MTDAIKLIGCILGIAFLFAGSPATAETIHVDKGNGRDIQGAIDECPKKGCTIMLAPRTFLLWEPLVLRTGVHLEGESRWGTYLVGVAGLFTGGALVEVERPMSLSGSIHNLTIKAEGNGLDVIGLDLTGARNFSIRDVNIWGTGHWEGIAIKFGDGPRARPPETSFFNHLENIDAGFAGNWRTGVLIDSTQSNNANHNYVTNLILRAERPIDIQTSGDAGSVAMIFHGCYIVGRRGVSEGIFAESWMEKYLFSRGGDLHFTLCTVEPSYFSDCKISPIPLSCPKK